jgi:DNA-binding PadR family transcriptional regulator
MYLDILVLSHLEREPSHGYELKRRVSATTAFVLHNNSLYPALRRFEDAGAVTRHSEELPGRPPRQVYALTEVGREMLHDLIAELPPDLAGNEEEFLTRLGLFDALTPAERRGVLATRDEALAAREQHLKIQADRAAASTGHQRWGALVTAELRERVARERAWLAQLAANADDTP